MTRRKERLQWSDTRKIQNIKERWMKEMLNRRQEYVHHFPRDLGEKKIGHSYITVQKELPVTRICNAKKPHLK